MYTTLIETEDLHHNLNNPDWVIIDCRYDLTDLDKGKIAYTQSHIPGAVFADVHDDLSGPPITDQGRHPMPSVDHLNALFRRLGINAQSQIIVYDASQGAFASRLWWLLRYMGHTRVALLDGGWQAWQEANLPERSGDESNMPGSFEGAPRTAWLVTVEAVPGCKLLVDSRDPARYQGQVEPIDKAAGHIPGAVNHFWQENLRDNGRFKEAQELQKEFIRLFSGTAPEDVVFYCGSGVTACHNLLALAHAGMDSAKLYAGSWSDWCSDPSRPISTGPSPGHME